MKKLIVKTSLLLSGLTPAVAFGQSDQSDQAPNLPVNPITDFSGLIGVIDKIAQWMFGILMALSTVFILYAAFLYIISQGSEDRIKTAKTILIYAVVGLIVAVLAGGINIVIQDFIGNM